MELNLGIIWEKHFCHMQPWHDIRSSLSIHYNYKPSSFIVGIFSLEEHSLLEPLYVMRKPFMERFHFKLTKNNSYLSSWLISITSLSEKGNKPETFTLHLDGACCQADSNKTISCTIPFQLAVYHLGGQGILIKDYSLWCGASGLPLHFSNSFNGLIHGASYLLFNRYAKAINQPFKKGWGQWHTIDWRKPF